MVSRPNKLPLLALLATQQIGMFGDHKPNNIYLCQRISLPTSTVALSIDHQNILSLFFIFEKDTQAVFSS